MDSNERGMDNRQRLENSQSSSTNETKSSTPSIEIPSINLPKGGGAIQGIGEKFSANPVTGTGSMTVPIATSPGRSGFGPELSLAYDSAAGNGPFGFGWSLSLPAITRKTSKGLPQYRDAEESDVFLLSGSEDLVSVISADGSRFADDTSAPDYTIHRYRPRIEGLFARIERWTRKADGDVHWRSISKDNILTLYGKDSTSRIVDPEDSVRIFSWLICETRDDKGNVVLYEYKAEDGVGVELSRAHECNRGGVNDSRRTANRYLKRILYGNRVSLLNKGAQRPRFLAEEQILNAGWMFEVVFDYGEHNTDVPLPNESGDWSLRKDAFSTYRAGFEVRTTRLCQRVLMFHHFDGEDDVGINFLVRSTDFTYSHEQEPTRLQSPVYTFLRSVNQVGYKRDNGSYLKRSLPPVEFEYTQPVVQDTVEEVDLASLENLPIGVDGAAYQWTDLHGEGIPGILTEQANEWYYKRNVSPLNNGRVEFSALESVASRPNLALATGAQIMDLASNGRPDLVMFDGPTPGLYEHDFAEGWESFRPFISRLNRNTRDPNLKFIDLNGDGHADVLITEDNVFVWHASLAEQGFGSARRVNQALDEEQGPRLVFADGSQSIYLSDLSGDGLTDLVRIRNGEVCYWPNLGYGRFGARVTMDNSPHFDQPDQFDYKRIRLADIDGSGTVDIIYLHRDGVRLYFNQSGNGWSEPQVLNVFPRLDDLVSIVPTDLLGNGTACLVWSSPLPGDARRPMRYVNLMGAQKPHLLIKTINNLGAETEIQYAPSTKFYLQDKRAGKPWITKLPFPVHVVEKVTSRDKWRKTSFSSSYSYHHGYFDGFEREFRGFGRVEQIDIEDYGTFIQGNVASPYITDDQTLYQPPVKTISWFHTGAFLQRDKILNQFEHEYFPNNLAADRRAAIGDFQEKQLPPPDLSEADLNTQEWREALRACKGLLLRQEIYELDIDALQQSGEHRPLKLFSTAYKGCHIKRLQARGKNKYAVFQVTESEAISYNYELDLRAEISSVDPRIAHTLNLKTDQYGNVLQSVAAVYPRRQAYEDASLPNGTDRLITQVQQEMHLAYTENRFTNDVTSDVTGDIDNYRLRLPGEVLTYELSGIALPAGSDYFELQQLRQYRLSEVHQTEGTAVAEIAYHLIASPGTPQKRAVQQQRILYFADDLTSVLPLGELNSRALPYETYTLAMTDELLSAILNDKFTAGIQADLANASLSGYLYQPDTNQYWIRSGIVGFAEDAATHFYLPEQYTDPFGNTTTLEYDSRDLFIARSTDPLGNRTQVVAFDYRVLQPSVMEDINGNFSEVIFDVLGLPTATAVKGKGDQADNLSGFTDALLNPDRASSIRFFAEPRLAAESIEAYQQRQQMEARRLLGNATSRSLYYFGEIEETLADGTTVIRWGENPASACNIVREQHIAQLGTGETSLLQIAFEYSDGGGNVLVTKNQAEPETEAGPLRWVANGKTILNNKGKPVKQYEPYFVEAHIFEEPVEVGVTPVMYYDAAGRLIRTESPDGTYSRVEFSQWHVSSYDPNDTILEPDNAWYTQRINPAASAEDQRAARLAAEHASTPASVFLDSLGREVISVAHNRVEDSAGVFQDEKNITFSKLDAEGKPLWIRDARGNLVMQYITPQKPTRWADESNEDIPTGSVPCYDIAGNLLFQHSMDGGDRWMINDATGQPFYAWDSNERVTDSGAMISEERVFHTTYDDLRRPFQQQLKINSSDWQLVERFIYGENQDNDRARNLRGQFYQHYDASGLLNNQRFDFKGNLLEVTRQLSAAYQADVIDWSEGSATNELEESFTQITEYDALNRMVRLYNWHRGEGSRVTVYEPGYGERGELSSEDIIVAATKTATAYEAFQPAVGSGERPVAIRSTAVSRINYDAKGQRQNIEYANGTVTRYSYDEKNYRLLRLLTTRNSDSTGLQDLRYSYDPTGNITEIRDNAQQTVFFANAVIEPHCKYKYDALYRLVHAEGREHAVQNNSQRDNIKFIPEQGIPFANSDTALQNYSEDFIYDSVGNILSMAHSGGTVQRWKRCYQYAQNSNRLLATGRPADLSSAGDPCPSPYVNTATLSQRYNYDTHGSMLNLNRTPDEFRLHWDYRDMIHNVNLGGGGQAWYNYDSEKQRTRKRIERNGNEIEERLYLGGIEIYRRWLNNVLMEEIETHHLFIDDQRVLMVEDILQTDNDDLGTGILFKFQYSNHLGSVGLELDETGNIISYEEYHPYGTTAYSANNSVVRSTRKRYRYTGMERDEETGLSYHSARYYLPWLGRWGSGDPIGVEGGLNIYGYCKNNTISSVDKSGFQGTPAEALPDEGNSPSINVHHPLFSDNLVEHLTTGGDIGEWQSFYSKDRLISDLNRVDINSLSQLQQTEIWIENNYSITVGDQTFVAWEQVPEDIRQIYTMMLLVERHGLTERAAAGIVGNLMYESIGIIPNRLEGSVRGTPQTVAGVRYSDEQIENGEISGGVGLAQWTNTRFSQRRDDLFNFEYGDDFRQRGAGILHSIKYQIDFLVSELSPHQLAFYRNSGTSVQASSDRFLSNSERPERILYRNDGHTRVIRRTNNDGIPGEAVAIALAKYNERAEKGERAYRLFVNFRSRLNP